MTRFQYAGPGPVEAGGELLRPGDVREFDQEPDYGPWECLDPPETDEDPETGEGDKPGPPGASPAATGAAPAPDTTQFAPSRLGGM